MKAFWRGAVVAALGAGCGRTAPECDLILVSVDTLRAERLGSYGAARDTDLPASAAWTPRWLAEQGVTWAECWAPAGKTIPSLASFWTGLEPLEHGALSHVTPIQGESHAERLREQGFRTIARVANASVTPALGFARGFEDYELRPKEQEAGMAAELVDRAAPVIERGEPLLLWAHFMAPHQPYAPPPEHDVYRHGDGPPGDQATLHALHLRPDSAAPEIVEHLKALYDGEIRCSSAYVQQLLAGLDGAYRQAGRGGLLDNAVVVFFSDHGEELADHHGYFPHAKSLYSGVIRVPLIIAGRGYEPGRKVADPVALADVLAMVLERRPPPRGFFVATWHSEFYAIRDARWTLLHDPCGRLPKGPVEPPQEGGFPYPEIALFDRRADPLEQHDLARLHPAEVRRLLELLQRWYDDLERVRPAAASGVDPALLSELGYSSVFEEQPCRPWAPERWQGR